jgi:hypothetical protein
MTALLVLIALVWIGCGVVAFGACYADATGDYPPQTTNDEIEDFRTALVLSFFGPLTMLVLWAANGYKYGLRYRRLSGMRKWYNR